MGALMVMLDETGVWSILRTACVLHLCALNLSFKSHAGVHNTTVSDRTKLPCVAAWVLKPNPCCLQVVPNKSRSCKHGNASLGSAESPLVFLGRAACLPLGALPMVPRSGHRIHGGFTKAVHVCKLDVLWTSVIDRSVGISWWGSAS